MSIRKAPKTSTFVPRFGSNRTNASAPAAQIGRADWCLVAFCGGLSDAWHIDARTLICNDIDRHLINCCNVVKDRALFRQMRRECRVTPFHPDVLSQAQERCRARESSIKMFGESRGELFGSPNVDLCNAYQWAMDYWICAWMGRSTTNGTKGEFNGKLPVRMNAGGGDSAVRFRSPTSELRLWHQFFQRCNFVCEDAFTLLDSAYEAELDEIQKRKNSGYKPESRAIYLDSPWPDDGDVYRFPFTPAMQRRLATSAARFKITRVVIRFGDHPLIREIYREPQWTWMTFTGRTQTNKTKSEVLILNGPVYTQTGMTPPPSDIGESALGYDEPQDSVNDPLSTKDTEA